MSVDCNGGLNYCCHEGNEVGLESHRILLTVMDLYMEVPEGIHMFFVLIYEEGRPALAVSERM